MLTRMILRDFQMTAFVSFLLVVTTLAVSASAQTAAKQPAAGDAAAGEAFFTGKGNCSSCHMVRGRGGILGPDLSNLARGRTVEQIEAALADPSTRPSAPSYRSVSVRLRSGPNVRGLVKYEDPFDLGLQGLDGTFHSIAKNDVSDLTREPSLMPKVDASPGELRNLLAYLMRLSADTAPAATFTGHGPIGDGTPFAEIARPKPGEWPTYHGHLSGNRHSPLNQINTSNVAQLAPKWTFPVSSSSQRAAAGHAGRRRRRDVRHRGERSRGARRAHRPSDLALQRARARRASSATPGAASTAASPCSAIASSW